MAAETAPEAEASRRLPSDLAPVPQSSTRIPPEGVVSSTQDVLPPKWLVPGPGAAMEPRVPQKRTSIPDDPSVIRDGLDGFGRVAFQPVVHEDIGRLVTLAGVGDQAAQRV